MRLDFTSEEDANLIDLFAFGALFFFLSSFVLRFYLQRFSFAPIERGSSTEEKKQAKKIINQKVNFLNDVSKEIEDVG